MLEVAPDAHKGDLGRLIVVGGAMGMLGASWLAGRTALHAGTGRVWVCQLDPMAPRIDPVYPELMLCDADGWRGRRADAVVVGPGMGTDERAATVLADLITLDLPMLLDADALNLVAVNEGLADMLRARRAPTILTPHPGEAGRLLGLTAAAVQAERVAAAARLCDRFGVIAVLKGARTVIAAGAQAALNTTGCSKLATAGTGDVLSGLIGALLARGIPAWDAALMGVWIHGRAGERMPTERPTASALLPLISGAIAEFACRRGG